MNKPKNEPAPKWEYADMAVVSRDGRQSGKVIGGGDHCQLSGCTGIRLSVRWDDGKLTRPCTKGLRHYKHHLKVM